MTRASGSTPACSPISEPLFDDELLLHDKETAQWAVEAAMTLFCPPHIDYEAMKDYYTDPEFSLNNLGEGLYGWMKKKRTAPGWNLPHPRTGRTPSVPELLRASAQGGGCSLGQREPGRHKNRQTPGELGLRF
ncbi:hypothetical protein ACFSQ7_07500 [Paenibacillus rhizoplanae]